MEVFIDGKVFDGEWHEDLMHGQGKVVWPDGEIYEGSFVNNQM